MATVSIASLGLGNADLTVIGKLSETGLSQTEVADAVVEGDKLKKGNITANQVGAYSKIEVDNLLANIDIDEPYLTNYYDKTETNSLVDMKQDNLVSGTNIKTINGVSVLGNGNIEITGEDVDLTNYYDKTQTETLLSNKVEKVDTVVYDGHLASTSNPHNTTASQVGAYSKIEVDNLLANIDIGGALTEYYDKTQTETLLSDKVDKGVGVVGATKTKITYNNDGIITGGADLVEADLPNISQAKITNLVSDLSSKQSSLISGTNIKTINGQSVLGKGNIEIIGEEVDLTNYYDKTQTYNKVETDSLVDTKQDTLVSGTSIKTVNGQSVLGNGNIVITSEEVDLTNYYDKTQTETLLSNKVDKEAGKGLSTNDFTDTFKQALELKKVQDISTDSVTKKLVVTYTDDTVANLSINDIITDVQVSGATLDATTNVLTLTSTDGGADVTVDLSDFVNSSELTTALAGKVSKIVSTDDAIVAFSGTTGEVKNTNLTKADLDTYIGKAGTARVSTNLKTMGVATVNWIGGIVPTAKAGTTTVTGLIGAVAGTWNKIGDSTTLLTTAKTTIVEAINELFNGKVSKIGTDDIEVTLATKGVILKSPNGTRYKITVNDDGSLQTTGV